MNSVLSAVLLSLAAVGLVSLLTVILCKYTAKKVLHPVSKRKPLDAWPDQFGLPYDNVSFKAQDGVELKGWFIPSKEPSDKTIILMHGWGMNRADILKNTYFLHDVGFNLFYFDFRALGESGGKTSSIGYLEIKDAAAAVNFLKQTYPQASARVGLYGLSMGGMVAICEAAHNPDIACVVAEASYYSFRRVVSRWAWVHRRVPYFPLMPIILHYIRRQLKANPERYSPKYNIPKIAPRPVFLIHGRYDNLVPAVQAKLLYKCAGEPKELWLVPGAKHNKCAVVGGFEYKQRLADFYKKNL
ncbi:alpha/beta hydrolase [Candidatus Avelusimicrobium caledoniensis]|uniref:alpha/beta hydrolase n=1 Tax=Candidatus Avelusimicrobium caledoniensis TaxID=3416220 RepID=UPI003D0F3F70